MAAAAAAAGPPIPDDDEESDPEELGPVHGPQLPPLNPFAAASPVAASPSHVTLTAEMFERMMQVIASRGNSSASSEGLDSRDLLRLLPKPEIFKVPPRQDEHAAWLSWWWGTRQYITALDHRFDSDIAVIEANLSREVVLSPSDPPGTAVRSAQLYAILCSLLKGKALSIVRQIDSKRGYEALRLLLMQYQPPSKVRSLGILSALTTIKSFDHKQPILPQLLELERAFEEYQRASGEPVQESLKSALLLRSITASMRSHIAASLDEDAGYSTLRECVLKFERTQFKWSGMHVFAPDGLFATGNVDAGGQQPMDVDAVTKGKGKKGKKGGKGKAKGANDKGKGKGQWNQQQNQWNQQKGKGKGDQSKGKQQSWQGGQGQGKGQWNQQQNQWSQQKGKGDKGKGKQQPWYPNPWQHQGKGYGAVSQVTDASTTLPQHSPSPSPTASTVGCSASQVQGSVCRVDFADGLVFDMTGIGNAPASQFRVQTITLVSDCASVCDSSASFASDLRDSENNDEIHCNHLPQSGPQAACEPSLQFVGELQDFPGDILDASFRVDELQDFPGDILDASFRESAAPSAAASPSSHMSSWCDVLSQRTTTRSVAITFSLGPFVMTCHTAMTTVTGSMRQCLRTPCAFCLSVPSPLVTCRSVAP